MADGFTSWNDFGSTQVDGDYENLVLKRKGTLTPSNYYYNMWGGEITLASDEVLALTSGLPAWRLGNRVFVITLDPVDYFVFGRSNPSIGDHGIAVWNSANTPVFSSNWKTLQVAQSVSINGVSVPPELESITMPSGRSYAVAYLQQRWTQYRAFQSAGPGTNEGTAINTVSSFMGVVSGNIVYIRKSGAEFLVLMIYPREFSDNFDNGVTQEIVIVDVTNF